MSAAVIDLSRFRTHFSKLDDQSFLDVESLRPYFLEEGVKFEDNSWLIKGAPKESKTINFDVAISPDIKLSDEPKLLYTVKLACVLIGTSTNPRLGNVGPENLIKTAGNIINFIRLLKFKYGLMYISSINSSVFEDILSDYPYPLAERLSLRSRLYDYLDCLSSQDICELRVWRTGIKPDLNIEKIATALGVSSRAFKSFKPRLVRFRKEHNFYMKAHFRTYLGKPEYMEAEKLKVDTLRKEVGALKKFLDNLTTYSELFPEEHRPQKRFFHGVNVSKFAKKHGRKGERTRDIPQPVMFKVMDRAIRWVIDYANPLLDYRDKAVEHYEFLQRGDNRGGTGDSRRHYAAKRMRHWFKENPLDALAGQPGAPYPITSFDKNIDSSKRTRTKISQEQIETARTLIANGTTQEKAAKEVGISKASLSRILNHGWAEDGFGLDKVVNEYLFTACLFVIYCFTARRQTEIESLEAGCCIDTPNGPSIRLYSAKNEQNYDFFPVTRLVARAVDILERLTSQVRTEENQKLLQVPTVQGGRNEFWQQGKMNEFAALVEADREIEGSDKWVFSEHQFRRFFAMTYFYKFDASDLPTLSWHLRHDSFDMTYKYLTDRDFATVFDEVMAEKVADLLENPGDPDDPIYKELHDLILDTELQSDRRSEKMIKKIKDIGLVINHVPDGICFGKTPDLKARSSCLYLGALQLSSVKKGSCKGCPNLAAFDRPQDAQLVVEVSQSPMMKKAREVLA